MYENMMDTIGFVKVTDPEIGEAMERELSRSRRHLELIASENVVSPAVLAAMGTVLTNKYAEGYPAHRCYGGCAEVDVVERAAIDRACRLFQAEHANVQPHSGSQANQAVYAAFLRPGDTILGMGHDDGGHLTHGSENNFSGALYHCVSYGVRRDGLLDYDVVDDLAQKHRPKLIVAGASSYARHICFDRFRDIADRCGALLMVDMAHIAGLVAAGLHPSPVPYADVVTTTTHKTLRGPRGGLILCKRKHAQAIDQAVFPLSQGGPLMHIIAAKAVAFGEALQPSFFDYQQQTLRNAQALAAALKENGLTLVSGGTDNHLILIDLHPTGLDGAVLERRLDGVGITANQNSVPGDPPHAPVAGGLRVGTPAITTRGLQEEDMPEIARCVADCVFDFEGKQEEVRRRVAALCARYPLYA